MQHRILIESIANRQFQLTAEQWLPAALEKVFAFFSDASQLESMTPPWMKFRVLTQLPIAMKEGTTIDYKLRVRGFPLRWTSQITVWEPMNRFVDLQIRGPYRYWEHEHSFEEENEGTVVRDRVIYRSPGGKLLHRWFVKPDILKIFHYRCEKLKEIFATH